MSAQKTFEAVAHLLAEAHRREDPATHTIYLAPDPQRREVRLVEISTTAPTSDDVFPVYFDATADVGLPSGVVLLSDDEWEKVRQGQLHLPEGWGTPDQLQKLA